MARRPVHQQAGGTANRSTLGTGEWATTLTRVVARSAVPSAVPGPSDVSSTHSAVRAPHRTAHSTRSPGV